MEYTEAAEILRRHNEWRRSDDETNDLAMESPTKLGHAIDVAVRTLAFFDIAMTTLRQIESTPKNAGAKRNASATVRFIDSQLEHNAEVK